MAIKIHCIEVNKEGFDNIPIEELKKMVGWIEPPEKEEDKWTVTMSDDSLFDCETQESAQILSSIEEVKAILLNKQESVKFSWLE